MNAPAPRVRWYVCRCNAIVVHDADDGMEVECSKCHATRYADEFHRDAEELLAESKMRSGVLDAKKAIGR